MVELPKIRDDGFHGGRCEVHIVNPWNWYRAYDFKSKSVKGKYIDSVSLYPTVMYYDRYPVGHPTKNCVLIIYAEKDTTAYSVTQSIRHIL